MVCRRGGGVGAAVGWSHRGSVLLGLVYLYIYSALWDSKITSFTLGAISAE